MQYIPENSVEIEKIILGSLITNTHVLHTYILLLDADFFKDDKHVFAFYGIKYLYIKSTPLDRFTLCNYLVENDENDFNWSAYMDELIGLAVNSNMLKGYVDYFVTEKLDGEAMHVSNELVRFNVPLKERIKHAINRLYALQHYLHDGLVKPVSEAILEWKNNVGNEEVYLKTPFSALNKVINGGFLRGELTVIGARPGMGKTEFAVKLLHHYTATQQLKCAFVSMRTKADLFGKMLYLCSTKNQTADKALQHINALEKLNLLNYRFFLTGSVEPIIAQLAHLKNTTGLDMVFIDTLQLLNSGEDDFAVPRDTMLGDVLKKLKNMAHLLNISIFCISELSRNSERRKTFSRPMLGDLRHSGFIEELADKVLLLYNPNNYALTLWEDGMPCLNQGEIMLAKNRNGGLHNFRILYDAPQMVFEDILVTEN